jgi:hypothetical protein
MKKLVTFLIVLALLVSLPLTALAATVSVGSDKAGIHAGEDVVVTVSLDQALTNVVSFDLRLRFNSSLFTLKSSQNGVGHSAMTLSALRHDATLGDHYAISFVDATSQGQTVGAGTLYTLVFTAKADITQDASGAFTLVNKGVYDKSFQPISGVTLGQALNVSVTTVPAEVSYTMTLTPGKTSVSAGEQFTVDAVVTGGAYNAFSLTLGYDPSLVTLEGSSSTNYTDDNGTVTAYGVNQTALANGASAIRFTFKAKAVTADAAAAFILTTAKAGTSEEAISEDAKEATKAGATVSITHVINTVNVTKPASVTGNSTAMPGTDYTFTAAAPEAGYENVVSVTIGGSSYTGFTYDAQSGMYTIPGAAITGDIVITVDQKLIGALSEDTLTVGTATYKVAVFDATAPAGKVYNYNGVQMVYSEVYDGYIAVFTGAAADFAAITMTAGTAITVNYDGDVNGSAVIDVNDAQLVSDFYNGMRQLTDEGITLRKLFAADVNGNKAVDTNDIAAVVGAEGFVY